MAKPLVRLIGPGEERLLRATRLAALADAPEAFTATLIDAEQRPADFWARQAGGYLGEHPCATWLAFEHGRGVGMVAGVDLRDRVEVIQVWIHPDHRGSGLVDGLVREVLHWLPRPRVDVSVVRSNQRARSAYERLGFKYRSERPGGVKPELEVSQTIAPCT